jgi:hypothetical protein
MFIPAAGQPRVVARNHATASRLTIATGPHKSIIAMGSDAIGGRDDHLD